MSKALIAKLRKSREVSASVGAFTFTISRPTDMEMLKLLAAGDEYLPIAMGHVIGWSGVTEDDIVGGGNRDPLPFDADLWRAWCADRPDFWKPIADAALAAYNAHAAALEAAAKN